MPLTFLAIDSAKPKEKPYKLSDGNGLHLLITEKGAKLWRLRYRIGGKQLMLSLGSYPEVSLATARQKRDDARTLAADIKELEKAIDSHTVDNRNKRKALQEKRNALAPQMQAIAKNGQEGQRAMEQLIQSAESSFQLRQARRDVGGKGS